MIDIAVAISTTGDEHRLSLLSQSVKHWDQALSEYGNGSGSLFVTVDGDRTAWNRAYRAVREWTDSVFLVGQPRDVSEFRQNMPGGRLGVAVNKNTGLELMMDSTPAVNLFLSDDDSWPNSSTALVEHVDSALAHSMVCWGRHRRASAHSGYASWTWPRGSVLYARRSIVEIAGGMVEVFGAGGHEHVEWSKRIHRLGLTPDEFCTPPSYVDHNFMGAQRLWHCEDMPRPGEPVASTISRRRHLTSVRRAPEDGVRIGRLMDDLKHSTSYVPYHAAENGRSSATL